MARLIGKTYLYLDACVVPHWVPINDLVSGILCFLYKLSQSACNRWVDLDDAIIPNYADGKWTRKDVVECFSIPWHVDALWI